MTDQPFAHAARSRNILSRVVRLVIVLGLLLVVQFVQSPSGARAQDELCFTEQSPNTTACISGRFRAFWEEQGGLAVFGYPLTDATERATGNGTFLTQYFERARFELHPANSAPYDVLLGRLGAEQLDQLDQDVRPTPTGTQAQACQFWAETQQNVCGSFLQAWRANGIQLDDDPALSDVERMALWGLPLTGVLETFANGSPVQTQWFERARFEQQADGTVVFGLLGSETLVAPAQATPEPTPAEPTPVPPTPTPIPPAEPAPPVAPPVPNVPFPSQPCNSNVPTPANGLQVWMADPNPPRESDAVACVRLILNGEAVNGANATVYRYIGDERRPSIPQSTGLDGVASFIFYIRNLPQGTGVPVEAIVAYQGTTYVAYTGFITR